MSSYQKRADPNPKDHFEEHTTPAENPLQPFLSEFWGRMIIEYIALTTGAPFRFLVNKIHRGHYSSSCKAVGWTMCLNYLARDLRPILPMSPLEAYRDPVSTS